jgi:hypothetical protein
MTITLDYADLGFEDDRDVLLADEYAFQYDLLYARITFRVDAADFTIKDEYTPLLDASAGLRRLVDPLADGEAKTYDSPVSSAKITFTRSGDQVAISANYTEATATVAFTELRDAVTEFHERVTHDVLDRYPGLAENPGAQDYLAPVARASGSDA